MTHNVFYTCLFYSPVGKVMTITPDFGFALDYTKNSMKLYEDYGPACIHRMFVVHGFVLKQHYGTLKLYINLDGRRHTYTLLDISTRSPYPFLNPLNKHKVEIISGINSNIPLCYQHSAVIWYEFKDRLPPNVLSDMVNCTRSFVPKDADQRWYQCKCPKVYYDITATKYDTKVIPFAALSPTKIPSAAMLFQHADITGPFADTCNLQCFELDHEVVLFHQEHAGIIEGLQMALLQHDWRHVILEMCWDDCHQPQVEISLYTLFMSGNDKAHFTGI